MDKLFGKSKKTAAETTLMIIFIIYILFGDKTVVSFGLYL